MRSYPWSVDSIKTASAIFNIHSSLSENVYVNCLVRERCGPQVSYLAGCAFSSRMRSNCFSTDSVQIVSVVFNIHSLVLGSVYYNCLIRERCGPQVLYLAGCAFLSRVRGYFSAVCSIKPVSTILNIHFSVHSLVSRNIYCNC